MLDLIQNMLPATFTQDRENVISGCQLPPWGCIKKGLDSENVSSAQRSKLMLLGRKLSCTTYLLMQMSLLDSCQHSSVVVHALYCPFLPQLHLPSNNLDMDFLLPSTCAPFIFFFQKVFFKLRKIQNESHMYMSEHTTYFKVLWKSELLFGLH